MWKWQMRYVKLDDDVINNIFTSNVCPIYLGNLTCY